MNQQKKLGIENLKKTITFLVLVFLFLEAIIKKSANKFVLFTRGIGLMSDVPDAYEAVKQAPEEIMELDGKEKVELHKHISAQFDVDDSRAAKITEQVLIGIIGVMNVASNIRLIIEGKDELELNVPFVTNPVIIEGKDSTGEKVVEAPK